MCLAAWSAPGDPILAWTARRWLGLMYYASVLVHLLAAIIWVGGSLFLALVVVPATRLLPPAERAALFAAVGRRFRLVGWLSIGLLVTSGLLIARYRGVTWESIGSGELLLSRFGRLLALKVAVVALMIAVTAWHDFVAGPASTRASRAPGTGSDPAVEALRRRASLLARLAALLAIIVVALGVALVRGLPWPW